MGVSSRLRLKSTKLDRHTNQHTGTKKCIVKSLLGLKKMDYTFINCFEAPCFVDIFQHIWKEDTQIDVQTKPPLIFVGEPILCLFGMFFPISGKISQEHDTPFLCGQHKWTGQIFIPVKDKEETQYIYFISYFIIEVACSESVNFDIIQEIFFHISYSIFWLKTLVVVTLRFLACSFIILELRVLIFVNKNKIKK